MRTTTQDDLDVVLQFSSAGGWGNQMFWIRELPNRENILVSFKGQPVAVFQVERVTRQQARLHFLPGDGSRKIILRGIIKLVPWIEKALACSGIRAVFFTSHSLSMEDFVHRHLGYQHAGDGGADGVMMVKGIANVRTL